MSITIKRAVHLQVKMDDSFRKNYILLINQLVEDLRYKISSHKLSLNAEGGDASYKVFITQKVNDLILRMDQLKQKIDEVKKCKDGDLFHVSTLDGQLELSEGDSVFSALGPVSMQADGSKITKIIS